MILEKAWAKVHGSYMRTAGGHAEHAAQHLLGTPAFTISHKDTDADTIWPSLKKYDEANFLMFSSSNSGTNDKFVDGIVQGHAYSLIGVHEFEAHGKLQRLLKIRNPWGKRGEWVGDWSDSSKLWTPELDKLCDHTDANDGIFFIPIEDYLTHYNQTAISITESDTCPISLANY